MVVLGRAFFTLCVCFWQVKDLGIVSGQSGPEVGGLYLICQSDWQNHHRIENSHSKYRTWEVPRKVEGAGPIYPSSVWSIAKALFWKSETQLQKTSGKGGFLSSPVSLWAAGKRCPMLWRPLECLRCHQQLCCSWLPVAGREQDRTLCTLHLIFE